MKRDRGPRKVDELTRRRNIHKEAVTPLQMDEEWLRRRGLILKWTAVIPNDEQRNDIAWGEANYCHITRDGPSLLYVSFKHHKIVRMSNPTHHHDRLPV